jgi:hypothetical protein
MSLRTTVVFPEPVPPAMPMINMLFLLMDTLRVIGRRSAYKVLRQWSPVCMYNSGAKLQ